MTRDTYIGRPKGKKNAKVHLCQQDSYGVLFRLCDWLGMDEVERVAGPVTCRHCLMIQRGERRVAFE